MTLVAPRAAGTLAGAPESRADVLEPGRLVELSGRLDFRSAHAIRLVLDQAIADGEGDLVVDVRLAEVHDSAGLGLIVGAHRRAQLAGRRLVVAHPSPRFERLVRAARLGRVLHRVA